MHRHPAEKTFDELFAARPEGWYTTWLTNDVPHVVAKIKNDKPSKEELEVRKKAAHSVTIRLGK